MKVKVGKFIIDIGVDDVWCFAIFIVFNAFLITQLTGLPQIVILLWFIGIMTCACYIVYKEKMTKNG